MRVLNRSKDAEPFDSIYVGRPSKWSNPFVIGRDGTRAQVIELYRISDRVRGREAEIRRELRGRDLVCWCSPLPCHADILLIIANELTWEDLL